MQPLVFSSSAIAAFKRCPKSYQFGYEMLLEPADTIKQYVHDGASFHAYAAAYYNGDLEPNVSDPMWDVWCNYLEHVNMPPRFLMVETPLYTRLLPEVYIRTTFDLVYEREDGTVVGRDYKTFEKSPTLDLDLDFQGRIYIAALQRKYPDKSVDFEYEYVRRVSPGTKNSRGAWKPEECYLTFPLVISKAEADRVWEETQWVAEAMLEAQRTRRFWRTDLKGSSPHTCGSCFYKNVCKADMEHGGLTDQDLAILAPTRKELITLPDGYN